MNRLAIGSMPLLALAAFSACSQSFPTRPIRVVIPFAAAGAADAVARVVAPRLGEVLGQSLVLDNRAGAGGTLGADIVAKAAPDGYTLLLAATGPNAVAPSIYAQLPYDARAGFTPIGRLSIQPSIVVANPGIGANTLTDLVGLARAAPGKLNFGSPGVGTTSHLGGELFKALAKVDIVHVPYKTGPLALTDLMGGRLQIIFDNIGPLFPHVKSGKLRALAVASSRRTTLLPELPTAAESGVPGFEYSIWFGLSGPARLPAAVVNRINAAIDETLRSPAVAQAFQSLNAEVSGSSPGDFAAYIGADIDRWARAVKLAGIKPN